MRVAAIMVAPVLGGIMGLLERFRSQTGGDADDRSVESSQVFAPRAVDSPDEKPKQAFLGEARRRETEASQRMREVSAAMFEAARAMRESPCAFTTRGCET
mmetsp:Transcript_36729/g.80265  ORF Transcript_36729/g.80265 Transcript_36729/m.80265 type:complete len:101 (-) Transcript_36729:324-626(-)|eukprot:CAMPEP_0204276780 /NCGR_PEP_ID=MMETSP0468-20130131/28850_1 /ASSEMBLY_ACC=CAM_ASM_000383 /TAXON_ID=2969 /ORGANISM="Oxyrrhis marina" /LENGTH=100 /DNA_ID=CAMNT_0051253475 /DNA_START=39 /DNA_END=341 /DNA_ORIENTATION=+